MAAVREVHPECDSNSKSEEVCKKKRILDTTEKMSSPGKNSLWKKNLKRKHEANGDGCKIPTKTMALLNSGTQKNPLCLLHELYRGLVFNTVSREGPVHQPIFTVSVEVNGIIYEGKGRNKKAAKHSAAEAALKSLVQFENPGFERPKLSDSCELMDFTSDVLYKEVNNFDASKAVGTSITIPNGGLGKNGLPVSNSKIENLKPQSVEKNPIMLLNELHPDAKYILVSDKGEQSSKYTTAVVINGHKFVEKGSSKKLSKAAVARSALLSFYNLSIPAHPGAESKKPLSIIPKNDMSIPQLFANHISRIINEKLLDLMQKDPKHIRRKVLAGFVLSKGYDLETCKVITVSTGTKCINGERMSVNGTVLNDSHAEIVSRRCLCNFLYAELEKHLNKTTKDDSIFEEIKNGFRVKNSYKFHLYITSAPCGDSRIFSPYDEYQVDRHPNRIARGKLRTKIECGEGTIPLKYDNFVQTWDGVLQGERLLTMSCSDKIAKWNVVGLQGALLSNFIEPIYLDSIVLGSLFHPEHLYRAVCGRIENTLEALPPPYRLNEPKLSAILNSERRQVGKTPNFSVNWTIGDQDVEVVNAVSGRTAENQISRISKCRLFYRFLRLSGRIASFSNLEISQGPLLYSQCKLSAKTFQVAKNQLYAAFSKARLGDWVKKPMEVDQFEWDIKSLEELFFSQSSTDAS